MFTNKWKELYEESETKLKNLEELYKKLQNDQIVSQQIIKEQKEKITLLEADTESIKRSQKNESEEILDLKSIIKEMKLRLDVAEKFETIDRIESYLKDFSVLFKFTDLIDQINGSSDVSALLDLNSKNQLERVTEFLPMENKPRTATDLQEKAEKLKAELKQQEEELLKKVESMSLHEKFSDATLERYFKLTEEDDGYTVEAFIGFDDCEKILIPESYKGKKILSLNFQLFYNCKGLEVLVIEAPVKMIPIHFCENSTIKKVFLPETVGFIDVSAFQNSALEEIKLGSNLKIIGGLAFMNTKLTGIDLPDSLEIIMQSAFESTPITKVLLPSKLKELEKRTFSNCKKLSLISLNKKLEAIHENALNGCELLREIIIPSSVLQIDYNAFGLGVPSSEKIIKCYPGSYAQQWARENGYTIKNAEED